ncbi:RNA polymerase sigma factor [Lysinibacillus piscis]|uniref:RNA polymerase sigma-70 region 2 domain-containing protein n=1 Tax=Lysinibacillus piscis TaxID=2518931 RepID=A0ABQ5NQ30_9BACI|nr:sigma factor [Lysinibacillus sp. KH24]GLC90476.1 hypothetical protein LYSBPC_36030 [Lysinibacillus sp. KH24]
MLSFHQIVDEHSEHLLRIAYYYTKNLHAAEDIVQDVFIKFSQSNYIEQGLLHAYLTKMTVNRSKDYLKSWSYRKYSFKNNYLLFLFYKRIA